MIFPIRRVYACRLTTCLANWNNGIRQKINSTLNATIRRASGRRERTYAMLYLYHDKLQNSENENARVPSRKKKPSLTFVYHSSVRRVATTPFRCLVYNGIMPRHTRGGDDKRATRYVRPSLVFWTRPRVNDQDGRAILTWRPHRGKNRSASSRASSWPAADVFYTPESISVANYDIAIADVTYDRVYSRWCQRTVIGGEPRPSGGDFRRQRQPTVENLHWSDNFITCRTRRW